MSIKNLITKEDITVGRYFTVISGPTLTIDSKKIEDKSYQNDCLKIVGVDFPLITYEDVRYSHNCGIINLNRFSIRFLTDEFIDSIKK